jgi:multiple sugar transport system substrate-binding protein
VRRLRGITWNHTRGFLPLVATAQRYGELHPGVAIEWQKRSLQEFADHPVERLAEQFDLLVIDHPFTGFAAAHDILVPWDDLLPVEFLADQAANSVGASHRSYAYGDHQWALAIDAATPVSAYRPDLLERYGVALPQTWTDLIGLARRGLVLLPAIPVDTLMNFYMLCIGFGEEPFLRRDRVVSSEVGAAALLALRELIDLCEPACLARNPIATYEALIAGERAVYCPFAYGYANYARPEYASQPLRFGGLVTLDGRRLRSTLGGAGLALSQHCSERFVAADYAQYVASPACQRGLFFVSGGQPGHRSAWSDPAVNWLSHDYFLNTLPSLDDAYLRPRYPGYIPFQELAGNAVYHYMQEGGDARPTLAELDRLYCESRHASGGL